MKQRNNIYQQIDDSSIIFYKKNTFEVLKKHFNSEEEFNIFFDNLSGNENKFKFISCGNYYHYLKFNNGLNANIQLIMVFSIIEKIYSEEDFIDFKDWCNKKQKNIRLKDFSSFKGLLECLESQYYEIHGSKQKTLGFFNKYFERQDKNKLLKSITFNLNLDNLEGEKIDFTKFVNIIYTMRNNFVHDSRFIPIHKEGSIGGNIKYNGKEIFIHFDLQMDQFLSMFEKAYLNYWKDIRRDKNAKNNQNQ